MRLARQSLYLFSFDSFGTLLPQLSRPRIHSGRGGILAHLNYCFCFCGGCQKLSPHVLDRKIRDLFLRCLRHPPHSPASSAQDPTNSFWPSWRSRSWRSQTYCHCCWLSKSATALASTSPPFHIVSIWCRLTNNFESLPCTFSCFPISSRHLTRSHLFPMDHDSGHIWCQIPGFLVVDFVKHAHFHWYGHCLLSLLLANCWRICVFALALVVQICLNLCSFGAVAACDRRTQGCFNSHFALIILQLNLWADERCQMEAFWLFSNYQYWVCQTSIISSLQLQTIQFLLSSLNFPLSQLLKSSCLLSAQSPTCSLWRTTVYSGATIVSCIESRNPWGHISVVWTRNYTWTSLSSDPAFPASAWYYCFSFLS